MNPSWLGDAVGPGGPTSVADAADALQYTTDTATGRVAATVLVLAGLAAVGLVIRSFGPRLRRRYSADDAEAIQAVAFSGVAVLAAWSLVVIWQALDPVRSSLQAVRIGPKQGVLALVAGLTLVVAYTLTRVSKGLLEAREGDVISAHRREMAHHLIQIAVYLLAAAFVLALVGVDPGDLVFGAGVLGLVLGLAARQTLGAVLAGLVLIFSRPFQVGDWAVIDDREGIVTDVTLFNTRLRTFEDEHVMIPNDEVAASDIVNRSRSGKLRVSVDVGVDYDADVAHAADVAETAMVECDADALLSDPSPAVVGKSFDDSAVVLECRFWISDPTAPRKWRTQTAVMRAIKDAFEAEGIKIPFPQRQLMGREEADGFVLAGRDGESTADDAAVEEATARGDGESAEDGEQATEPSTDEHSEDS